MEKIVSTFDVSAVESYFKSRAGAESDKKVEADLALRNYAVELLEKHATDEKLLQLANFSVELAQKDLCGRNVSIVLLSDIFDATTTDRCENMFAFVEDRIPLWKSPQFFDACRNHILRMSNDLLRRLSRSVDVSFCGRILLFLARCLPLTEKSGLNLISQFNVDNLTRFDDVVEELTTAGSSAAPQSPVEKRSVDVDMEEGETDDAATSLIPIDYNLYRKFWSLQRYFANPTSLYQKPAFLAFKQSTIEVLTALSSYKLESHSSSAKQARFDGGCEKPVVADIAAARRNGADDDLDPQKFKSMSAAGQQHVYFAKYLTSQKLLQLQLNDSNFRRYVLLQFLILFQYLTSDVKFKDAKKHEAMLENHSVWIFETLNKCYELLRETQPDGKKFAETVRHVLKREEYWISWKNNGCDDFTKRADTEKMPLFKKRARPKFSETEVDLSNPELTRLWKLSKDNFEACKQRDRQFEPTFEEFFEEAIEQGIVEGGVAEKSRLVNDENFRWRAFRLIVRKRDGIFETPAGYGTAKDIDLGKVLQQQIDKIAATIPKYAKREEVREPEQPLDENTQQINAEPENAEEDEQGSVLRSIVTVERCKALSDLIGGEWSLLAKKMGFSEERIAELGKEVEAAQLACLELLKLWREQEGVLATGQRLQYILQEAELFNEDVAALLRSTTVEPTLATETTIRTTEENSAGAKEPLKEGECDY